MLQLLSIRTHSHGSIMRRVLSYVVMGILALLLTTALAQSTHAIQPFSQAECIAAGYSPGTCAGGGPGLTIQDETAFTFVGRLTAVVNVFLVLVSIVAMIAVLVGGVRYITSRGDENAAAQAKRTILWAIVGLIVIGLAWSIVDFTTRSVACPPATILCTAMPPEFVGLDCPCDDLGLGG